MASGSFVCSQGRLQQFRYSYEVYSQDISSGTSLGTYLNLLVLNKVEFIFAQGGILVYGGDQLAAVNNATAKFAAQVKDPKAQIITTYNYIAGFVCSSFSLILLAFTYICR